MITMNAVRLKDLKSTPISRGEVFRFPAKYPYESIVDFMVVETTDSERRLGFMVATGYSAGHTVVLLPPECLLDGTVMISSDWLYANWNKWVYLHCSADEVIYVGNYPEPSPALS